MTTVYCFLEYERFTFFFFFFSSRRRHTRCGRDWSSDVCSSDLRTVGGSAGRGRPGADRGRALLAVFRDRPADARVGGARSEARPEAAHAPRRDRRGGGVLPRALRLQARRVPAA